MKVNIDTTIEQIVQMSRGTLLAGDLAQPVYALTSDSRELGRDNLFIPLVGEHFDGHMFIKQLLAEKKIHAFLTMHAGDKALAEKYSCSAILCDDTLAALGNIAAAYRTRYTIPHVGITGTNGKTTTKELLAAMLATHYTCLKNEKNYNNEIGVPFTLLQETGEHTFAVIEMGMNHSGELMRLSKIVSPDLALITNVGEGHLEFLGSIENVAYAKAEIMHGMRKGSMIFLNNESQCIELLKEQARKHELVVTTYGLEKGADLCPESYHLYEDHGSIQYRGYTFEVPLYGLHNMYNVMAAIAVAEHYDVPYEKMQQALRQFPSVDKRSQIIHNNYIVINDTYNANPLSLRLALQSVSQVYTSKRKIAVIADMKELGTFSEYYHKEAGKEVVRYSFDILYTWGEMASWIAEGALAAGMSDESVKHFTKKQKLVEHVSKSVMRDDVILVKGSRSMKMEEVAEALIR